MSQAWDAFEQALRTDETHALSHFGLARVVRLDRAHRIEDLPRFGRPGRPAPGR